MRSAAQRRWRLCAAEVHAFGELWGGSERRLWCLEKQHGTFLKAKWSVPCKNTENLRTSRKAHVMLKGEVNTDAARCVARGTHDRATRPPAGGRTGSNCGAVWSSCALRSRVRRPRRSHRRHEILELLLDLEDNLCGRWTSKICRQSSVLPPDTQNMRIVSYVVVQGGLN